MRANEILFESIASVDKKQHLKEMLKKANLVSLSKEIIRMTAIAKLIPVFEDPKKKETLITFLVSLDYLVKGLFTHSQIRLLEQPKKNFKSPMNEIDIKYPILIGD